MESNTTTVLIIEDIPEVAVSIQSAIQMLNAEIGRVSRVDVVASVEDAEGRLSASPPPNLVLVDMEIFHNGRVEMPAGYYLLRDYLPRLSQTEWIAMTGHHMLTATRVGNESLADALFELPLLGIWYKDDFPELLGHLRAFYDMCESPTTDRRIAPRFSIDTSAGRFVTNDGQFYFRVRQAAKYDTPVLLCGERGTEKELVARAIHGLSVRSSGQFLAFDGTSLDSEQSDALSSVVLKQLTGGSLYLENIDLLPGPAQLKLARHCSRDGGFNVRLMGGIEGDIASSANSRPARVSIADKCITVSIPSLSERRSDIPVLVSQFLQEYNQDAQIRKSFAESDRILVFIQSCDFPDNTRGVRRLVDYLTTLRPSKVITWHDVVGAVHHLFGLFGQVQVDGQTSLVTRGGRPLAKQPSELERRLLDYLIRNEGRVCGKDEIIQAVWPPDTQPQGVSDDAIAQLVSRLRDLIEIDPGTHQYIRTRRKQGYLFVQY